MPRMLVTSNWIYVLMGTILMVSAFGYAAFSAKEVTPAALDDVRGEGR